MKDEEIEYLVHEALEDFADGSLNDERLEELQQLMLKDERARKCYLDYNLTNHSFKGLTPSFSEEAFSDKLEQKKSVRLHLPSLFVGLASAALVLLSINLFFHVDEKSNTNDTIAVDNNDSNKAMSTFNTVLESQDFKEGDSLEVGKSSLKQGVAELEFRNGVVVVLEAPISFEVVSEEKIILNHGKLWARCDFPVEKFEVSLPSGHRIIDMGTEFGVSVKKNGKAEVHVFDGQVDLTDSNGIQKVKSLFEGKAVKIDRENYLDVAFSRDNFTTKEKLAYKRWEESHNLFMKNSSLQLNFDFNKLNRSSDYLENLVENGFTSARIHEGMVGQGRWQEKSALIFDHNEQFLEWPVNRRLKAFTFAVWVKIDRFDHPSSAILYTAGKWKQDHLGIHLKRDGGLRAIIQGRKRASTGGGVLETGVWHHIAVTCSSPSYEIQVYIDGQRKDKNHYDHDDLNLTEPNDINFENMSIGAWCEYKDGYTVRDDSRNLRGRIDEFLLFDSMLSENEIVEIYQNGKP